MAATATPSVGRPTAMANDNETPKPHSRILGALTGAFAGFFLGIMLNILVYTVSDRAIAVGWADFIYGGVVVGTVFGVLFPAIAKGIAWIIAMFLPVG